MQFFWKYVDDLMGKGIETIYIIELLFYVSASLIPLALPLAMLLSSIMTMGNLAENNELTALKASGLSLYRILRPLTLIVLIISFATFLFANYVIPVANYKWRALIYDFQNTKVASIIVPGVYTKEIEGYAIKAMKKTEDGTMYDITIHDRTLPNELKVIKAEKGVLYKSQNGKYLFFKLEHGSMFEEMQIQSPIYDVQGNQVNKNEFTRETRRSTFDAATYKVSLVGFTMNRTNDENFKDDYEMLTVFQIKDALDSAYNRIYNIKQNFITSNNNSLAYFQSLNYLKLPDSVKQNNVDTIAQPIIFDSLSVAEWNKVYTDINSKMTSRIGNIETQITYETGLKRNVSRYLVEFHRKFALTVAIIVLFFVGAPLGAIVKKGGFGAPVVIAALLFMLYFVLITIGQSMVESEAVSPFLGMWFATMILTPIAIILMIASANDLPLLEKKSWIRIIGIFRNRKKAKSKS